jgi:uncharacterized protein (DUF58 family)
VSAASSLFSAEEMRRLDRLRIRRRRPARTDHPGDRRSGRVGSGVIFADHRDYAPGDDLRYVDWNVYARFGDLVVKRFEAEENLDLLLCVDRSLSMTGAKSRKARRLAAALGHIALAHLDCVRLAWLPVVPSLPVTAHRGRGRAGPLLASLANTPEEGVTHHAGDIGKVLAATKRRGMAVVLSDFYDPDNAVAALAGLRSRGMDVAAVHLLDVADVDLPPGDSLLAVDRETGVEVEVDVTPAFLESLRRTWRRRADSLERWCVTREVMYQRVDVSASLWDVLAEMLGRGIAVGAA